MMDTVNENLATEICMVLVAEQSEFVVERAIINDVIYPTLRRYFMSEFQLEFSIIDVYRDCNCKNLPNIERSELLLTALKRAQKISSGLCALIMLGDKCGELQAPKKLTNLQYNHVLNFLQSKKDLAWKLFISKYVKSKQSDEYLLDENINAEDTDSILNSIDSSILSKPNDIFTESFIYEHLSTVIDKSMSIISIDRTTISSAQVLHRITTNSYTTATTKSKTDTIFQANLQKKYDAIIKATKKKFLPNNFAEYTISNLTLLDAEREVRQNKEKLSIISEPWNFLGPKNRSLSKDFKVNSSSDMYLQIFLEHVCKLVRETSVNLLLKREITTNVLSIESLSHLVQDNKIDNEELSAALDKEREREQNIFQNYFHSNTAKMPGLIFGPIGSGKTSLLLDLMNKLDKKPNMCIILRHCGKTVSSSNLQLLICSISDQINSIVSKKPMMGNACEYAVCVYDFWMSLNKAGPTRSVILLLDDVENLFPNSHTDMVKWLPPSLPIGVKVILTTSSDSFYQGFKKRYEISNIINLTKLDPKECIRMLPQLIAPTMRQSVSEAILNQANFCVQENSTPLFLQLLSKTVGSVKEPDQLTANIKSLFKIFLERLQLTTNPIIIKHIMSYVALSRFGLSVSELTDILSLDNRILSCLNFTVDSITSFRFPTYLSCHYLSQCDPILSLIQTNGKLLIRLKHQIFTTAIIEHYQLLQDDGKFFYQTLYDYWTSRYSGDKLKPLFERVSEDDEPPPGDGSHLYVKRSIASQPYYTLQKNRDVIANQRKLLELPHLLIKFDKPTELYKLVIFNFEYLFATLHQFGINHLISELYFNRQINEIKNNNELELLLAQLRLLSTDVIKDAKLLAPELTGRLSHFVGSNSLISQLHHQIDHIGTKVNAIVAAIPCYPTIDIENMRIEIGTNKELLFSALSPDNRFISTLIRDIATKDFLIIIWDSRSATKSQIINLGKIATNTRFQGMLYMPQSDEFVVLQYDEPTSCGIIIVTLEFSSIENTIKFPRNTSVKIENLSKSHLYLNINGESQVFMHPSAQRDLSFNKLVWPTQMTPNDRYLIGPKPISTKATDANKTPFNLRVMNAGTGEVLSFLSLNMASSCLLANVRNETLFVGTKSHGTIYRFDIGQIAKKDAKSLKNNLELKLCDHSSLLIDDMQDCITKFYPNVRVVKFQLSVDEKFLLAEYVFNDSIRSIGVWNLGNKALAYGTLLDISATVAFSVDGHYIYHLKRNGTLHLFHLANSTHHTLQLIDVPEQIYMLRAGSFFLSFTKSIKLTTLKALLQDYGNQDNSQNFQPETFCNALKKPKLSGENIVVYSNHKETSTFLYYKLTSNCITALDISHTNESLTDHSTDRFLSPDGEKLLLVFGFKLANWMITDQEFDLDVLTIKSGSNGHLISNLNDYRKPQIPRENYFTGKSSDSRTTNKTRAAYDQKIIKIIDLKTSKTFFQVSLSGEEILKFTDTLLLTFKPDYASLTRSCDDAYDIVSIYDVITARFVSSLYLEHPVVDCTMIPGDKDKLLISCGNAGKLLKLLGGDYFSTTIFEFNVQTMLRYYDEFARSSIVTKMFTFRDEANGVLLQYSWLDSNGVIKIEKETYYAKIDTTKREVVCHFMSMGKITDVRSDGSLAIDSQLNIYDLQRGNIHKNLQASIGKTDELNNCVFVNLFSQDGAHIVSLDLERNAVWVIKYDELCLAVGKALLTSSFEDNHTTVPFMMELALDGQIVIVYNDCEFKIFVVKLEHKSVAYENNYKSVIERIKKISIS